MGGFGGPRMPYPGQYGPQGRVYGQSPDLVGSRTPVANTIVDGINSFVESFKKTQDDEKQAAMQRAMSALQAAQMGIPIDMKKTARDLRTAGINLDFDNPTPRQMQQQQAPPMMGMGPGMQPSPQIMGPQGGGQMPMPMPQGGGMQQGGRPGFLGRLGNILRGPQAQGDVPQDAPVMGYLQRLQQQGQASMNAQDQKAQIINTLATAEVGSPEFMDAANRGMVLGITKDIPDNLKMDQEVQQLAKALKVSPDEIRQRVAAAKFGTDPKSQADFIMGYLRAGGTPESAPKVWQGIVKGSLKPSDMEIDNSDPKEFEKAKNYFREQFPDQAPQVWALMAGLDQTRNWDALQKAYQQFGPSKDVAQNERNAAADTRAARGAQLREAENARAAAAAGRAEESHAEKKSMHEKERWASVLYANSGMNAKQAVKNLEGMVRDGKVLDSDALDIKDIILTKDRGRGLSLIGGQTSANPDDQGEKLIQ